MEHRKRFLKIYIGVLYLAGLLIFSLSSMTRYSLSDFQLGFCEGMSLVLILTGFVYLCWSLAKRENPFKL